MNPTEYREATLALSSTRNQPLTGNQAAVALYALGLAGEAGEVCDEVKKALFHGVKKALFHGKEWDRQALIKEIGDVLWYVDRLLLWLDATMKEAMEANVAKLRARYPDGWDAATQHHSWTAKAQQ
jgi:NTP pyrophosphatase (non-canonical NTP hydrolase)